MMQTPAGATHPRPLVGLLLAGATGLIGAATWLVLADMHLAAGACAAGAGGFLLALSGVRSGATERFLDSTVDRVFDGCILGAIAWSTRRSDLAAATGALVALGASFLAAYVAAKGKALGYGIESGRLNRAVRYALVSVGLMSGWISASLWALVAMSAGTAVVRASNVVKEERA
ncbi:MAG: hypothetical protein WD276_04730 [Actinomycetota bacterium]